MLIPDLDNVKMFLLVMIAFYAIIVGRYLLISGIFYLFFYWWSPEKWSQRKLGAGKKYSSKQFRREISWSIITATCFAFIGTLTLLLWQQGFTKVYTDIFAYPLWWLPLSLALAMLIDETYYYWIHRLMHHPRIFRHIHKIHHQSTITSPWTAFAFHPVEGLLLSLPLPLTLLFIPMHPAVIIIQLMIMTFSSVINHLDIEVYPAGFHHHRFGRWLIGATHHSLHHKQFKYNFGLYFTFWDKWKKTESPAFNQKFERATAKKNEQQITQSGIVEKSK